MSLERILQLAGLPARKQTNLTEGVMAIPGIGIDMSTINRHVDEKAPPGEEALVMKLKKQYPGSPEKAFATAWSIYNKKHGKADECAMEEEINGTPDVDTC